MAKSNGYRNEVLFDSMFELAGMGEVGLSRILSDCWLFMEQDHVNRPPKEAGVWGAVERKTGLGACHCKMIGIPASKAGQFMKRKKSYAKPRRASVAD